MDISNQVAEQLLIDLVSIPSPSHHEKQAVEHLVNWMRAYGYDQAFVDDAGNAVGIIGSGTRDVMLLGHIDTFGGFPDVRVDARTLYGRGSVDAKSPLCAFAIAACRARLTDDVRVIVVGAVEEESSSSKGARHIRSIYQPQMCIIGEPSQWDRITLGYKGRLLIRWRYHGALSHSAGSALSIPEIAVDNWLDLVDYTKKFNGNKEMLFSKLDIALQEINSGQDGAYGWADMLIGFRLPPNFDVDALQIDLRHQMTADIEFYGYEPAYAAPRTTNLSRYFRRAIRKNGGSPRFVYKTGTSDMNIVAPHWSGCEFLAYGAGDSALDHTPDEHVDLDEWLRSVDILTDVLSSV